jgi:hypothetical protein
MSDSLSDDDFSLEETKKPLRRESSGRRTKKKVLVELSDDSESSPLADEDSDFSEDKQTKTKTVKLASEIRSSSKKKTKPPTNDVLELSDDADDSSLDDGLVPSLSAKGASTKKKSITPNKTTESPAKIKAKLTEEQDDEVDDEVLTPDEPVRVKNKTMKSQTKKPPKKKRRVAIGDQDEYDILFPEHLLNSNTECTILVQLDPVERLELEGAVGAVGRIEADDEKGTQCI